MADSFSKTNISLDEVRKHFNDRKSLSELIRAENIPMSLTPEIREELRRAADRRVREKWDVPETVTRLVKFKLKR